MIPSLGILGTVLWISMIYDCVTNEPERNVWLWILIILNLPAALLYFFVRFLPRANLSFAAGRGSALGRFTRRRELQAAELAAQSVGTAHHWVELGRLLQDTGQPERAFEAFRRALERDAEDLEALWGAGTVALEAGRYAEAAGHIERLLGHDPDFRRGDASAAFGRALVAVGETERAREHLLDHLRRWGHPEARLLLAPLLKQADQAEAARTELETLIAGVRGGPAYHYRNHRAAARQAERLLRRWNSEGTA
jgi:hypothetical protein